MTETTRSRRIGALAWWILIAAVACSGSGDGAGQAVRSFYDHLDRGDYDAARRMYTPQARSRVEEILDTAGGFPSWARTETREGTIQEIRILEESAQDSGVRVAYEIVYEDGTTTTRAVPVERSGGRWRLGLIE